MKSLIQTNNESTEIQFPELYDYVVNEIKEHERMIYSWENVEGWKFKNWDKVLENTPDYKKFKNCAFITIPEKPIYVEFKDKWGELKRGYIFEFDIRKRLKQSKRGWKMYCNATVRVLKSDGTIDKIGYSRGINSFKLKKSLKPIIPSEVKLYNLEYHV